MVHIYTDIISAIPALIKGAELLTARKYFEGSRNEIYEVHSQVYAFFEVYNVKCVLSTAETENNPLGLKLIVLGIWVMFGSTLAELVVWRDSLIRHLMRRRLEMDVSGTHRDDNISESQASTSPKASRGISAIGFKVRSIDFGSIKLWLYRALWPGKQK